MTLAMSPFAGFTSDVGAEADVGGRLCRGMKLFLNDQSWARRGSTRYRFR